MSGYGSEQRYGNAAGTKTGEGGAGTSVLSLRWAGTMLSVVLRLGLGNAVMLISSTGRGVVCDGK